MSHLSADERVIVILSVTALIVAGLIFLWWQADRRRLRKGLDEDQWLDRR